MIHIVTRGPTGPEFRKWYRNAVRQRKEGHEHGHKVGSHAPEPGVFQKAECRQIWSELKAVFLHEVFHYKCGYCEGKYGAGDPWHVEHYRPKSEVTEGRNGWTTTPGISGWPTSWYNLLLSCGHCNTWEERTPKNERQTDPSKSNEFRIKGTRVKEPGRHRKFWLRELVDEQPLLLNPYFDEPGSTLRSSLTATFTA